MKSGCIFEIDKRNERIKQLDALMEQEGFWGNAQKAGAVIKEIKRIKATFQPWQELCKYQAELAELIGIIEQDDEQSISHMQDELAKLERLINDLEFRSLLGDEQDIKNAILSINAGAGGTESCDWAAMLLRMYIRWAEGKGYSVQTIDYLAGDDAGVKNVTMIVKGEHAYGYLKAEEGVHRLVRISPFDANKRRHTSFASVDVIPEIEDDINIEIKSEDIRVDVYRSSGPGGQGVNTTDSAVRITHIPTGIVVQCQDERSQHKNRLTAMKVLKARLCELERQKQKDEQKKEYASKQRIEWGSQIRSYVLHPYNMVKDHRTDYETSQAQAVLDGRIDEFIESYLKWQAKNV